jgi:hypothetical protein
MVRLVVWEVAGMQSDNPWVTCGLSPVSLTPDFLKNNQGIWTLSQKDGLAIWVRPRILSVNANGQPTNGTLGTLLEEVLHTFSGDGLHRAARNAAERLFGAGTDMTLERILNETCL